jgi:dsRNA-specific ribonuclease
LPIKIKALKLFLKAIQKHLNEYIVSENFSAKENWLPLFLSNLTDEPKLKVKLADKSLADCIEALIGVYLIHLGVNGAKSFIQWLDFTISDAEGRVEFFGPPKKNTFYPQKN